MPTSMSGRIAFYAGVALLVLGYVALTSRDVGLSQEAGARAEEKSGDDARPAKLVQRLAAAAGIVVAWIAIDLFVAIRFRSMDQMVLVLVRILVGWGLLLALGALLSAGHQRLLAAAIVFGVTAAFVALWIGALAARRVRHNAAKDWERNNIPN